MCSDKIKASNAISGYFKPLQIDFKKNSNSSGPQIFIAPIDQAITILNEVELQRKKGFTQVGITYSANSAQTQRIKQTYEIGGWHTHTDGANQAAVIAAIENLLNTNDFQHLQNVFRILPITTIPGDANQITHDLNNIKDFIAKGGVALGWQNQDTVKTSAPYAVGGGVTMLSAELNDKIQTFLLALEKK